MILGGRVHVIHMGLVTGQDGNDPNELPAGVVSCAKATPVVPTSHRPLCESVGLAPLLKVRMSGLLQTRSKGFSFMEAVARCVGWGRPSMLVVPLQNRLKLIGLTNTFFNVMRLRGMDQFHGGTCVVKFENVGVVRRILEDVSLRPSDDL